MRTGAALMVGGGIAALGLCVWALFSLMAGDPSLAPDSPAMAPEPPGRAAAPEQESRGGPVPIPIEQKVVVTGIAGRVIDEAGAPIAGATVTVEEPTVPASGAARFDQQVVGQVQSDASGAFELTGLDGGSYHVVAERRGFGFLVRTGVAVDPGCIRRIEIILLPRPERVGRVIGPGHEPVARAEVLIRSNAPFGEPPSGVRRVSDGGGWFTFSEPGDPRYVAMVYARKAGVGDGSVSLDTNPVQQVHVVKLKPLPDADAGPESVPEPGVISGNVIDLTSHKPVAGVLLEARLMDWHAAAHHGGVRVTSGADGRFLMEGLPRGSIGITTESPRWLSQSLRGARTHIKSLKDAPRIEVTIPVVEGGTVEGKVVDESGRPVEGVAIDLGFGMAMVGVARTGPDGTFRVSGVYPDPKCRVAANRPHVPRAWSRPFELPPGGTVTGVTMTLTDNPALIVEVVGLDGRRVEGVAIRIAAEGDLGSGRPSFRTGRDGRVVVRSSSSDRVTVDVEPESLPAGTGIDDEFTNPVALKEQEVTVVTLRLRPEVVIRGSVTLEDGTPVQGLVRCDPLLESRAPLDGTPFFEHRHNTMVSESARPKFVSSDARGTFTLSVRSRSSYHLTEVSRVVRDAASSSPALEVFVPVERGKALRTDAATTVIVRRLP